MVQTVRWYESRRAGLGTVCLDVVDTAVVRIAETPQRGSLVPGISDQTICTDPSRLPFHVVYLELPETLNTRDSG